MNAPILSPKNPDYPPASDTLAVDSLNGIPPSYRWALQKSVENPDKTVSYQTLIDGNGAMSEEQWAEWTTQPDSYVLECAAEYLGVTLK